MGRRKRQRLYEVERVVDHSVDLAGRKWYLVRWAGYAADADSWEPEAQLSGASWMVAEYHRRRAAALSPGRSGRLVVKKVLDRRGVDEFLVLWGARGPHHADEGARNEYVAIATWEPYCAIKSMGAYRRFVGSGDEISDESDE